MTKIGDEAMIFGMTPEELIQKVKSGEISSRKYDSYDDFLITLKNHSKNKTI